MKRRNFIKNAATASLISAAPLTAVQASTDDVQKGAEYYELRTYELEKGKDSTMLENYLKNALIPALKRNGAGPIGVFVDLEPSDTPKLFLLITYPKFKTYGKMAAALVGDSAFQAAAKSYHSIAAEEKPYARIQSSFFEAFDGMPQLAIPQGEHILELRIYESANEDAHRRKVMMFDTGEIDIFLKTGLNPVFFGKALIGSNIPNLTYLLYYKDMETRKANWKKFIEHPDWAAIKDLPQYKGTVSNITNYFLKPTDYSDL